MNILESVLQAGGGAAVQQMAKSLGLGESQVQSVVGQLLPAVSRALANNASTSDGVSALLSAISRGNHQRYLEDPSLLNRTDSVQDGNGILGHLFGSKDVSRNIATRAAENTGVSSALIKKMLPMVASIAMAALSRKMSSSGMTGQPQPAPAQTSGLGKLASFLDFDGDGSIADDLLGIAARRFFS